MAALLVSLLLILAPGPILAQESWQANLETPEGRAVLLASALARHPQLLQQNPHYPMNVEKILIESNQVIRRMGRYAENALTMAPSWRARLSTQYFYNEEHYPDRDIDEIRVHLRRALRELTKNPTAFQDAQVDSLEKNLDLLASENLRTRSAFLILSPMLRRKERNPDFRYRDLTSLRENIDQTNGFELEYLYRDLYRNRLEPIARNHPAWIDASNSVRNQFINRVLASRLKKQRIPGASEPVPIQLSIEEVPKPLTALRGAVGADCSPLSVPYHGYLDSTHVYWIWNNSEFRGLPVGYLFVADAKVNGQTAPFFITINSLELSVAEARAAMLMVGQRYESRTVIAARSRSAVNSPSMWQALWKGDARVRKTKVPLPAGWLLADNHRAGTENSNYYLRANLERAAQVPLNLEEQALIADTEILAPEQAYRKTTVPSGRLERAILAYHLPKSARWLGVNDEDTSVVRLLLGMDSFHQRDPVAGRSPLSTLLMGADLFNVKTKAILQHLGVFAKTQFLINRKDNKDLQLVSRNQYRELAAEVTSIFFQRHKTLLANHITPLHPQFASYLADVGVHMSHLSMLPKVPNVPHYFIDQMYIADFSSPNVSPLFIEGILHYLPGPYPEVVWENLPRFLDHLHTETKFEIVKKLNQQKSWSKSAISVTRQLIADDNSELETKINSSLLCSTVF